MVVGDGTRVSAILARCVFRVQLAQCLKTFWNISLEVCMALCAMGAVRESTPCLDSERTRPLNYYFLLL